MWNATAAESPCEILENIVNTIIKAGFIVGWVSALEDEGSTAVLSVIQRENRHNRLQFESVMLVRELKLMGFVAALAACGFPVLPRTLKTRFRP